MPQTTQEQIARLMARALHSYERGDSKQSAKLAAQAYDLAQGATEQTDLAFVDILDGLASLLLDLGQSEKAVALYEQALRVTQSVLGEQHADVAARLNDLGTLYYSVDNYPAAEREFSRALEI